MPIGQLELTMRVEFIYIGGCAGAGRLERKKTLSNPVRPRTSNGARMAAAQALNKKAKGPNPLGSTTCTLMRIQPCAEHRIGVYQRLV